jgi:hypothetical protein
MYSVQACCRKKSSLIDQGANGGIAGIDTRVIERRSCQTVDIRGIDNHEITSIPIVTAGAVARSQRGVLFLKCTSSTHIICSKEGWFILHVNYNLLPMMATTT